MLFFIICFVIAVLGGASLTRLEDSLKLQLPPPHQNAQLQTYFRDVIGQKNFFSGRLHQGKKCNSFTVVYRDEGQTSFCKSQNAPSLGLFCVMQLLFPTSTPSLAFELSEAALDFSAKIYHVQITNTLKLVPVAALRSKCILIFFEKESFVALMSAYFLLE